MGFRWRACREAVPVAIGTVPRWAPCTFSPPLEGPRARGSRAAFSNATGHSITTSGSSRRRGATRIAAATAVVKHMAVNLLRQAKPTTSLKNRKKLSGWNLDHLDRLIRGAA
jgi:hypothetical protein